MKNPEVLCIHNELKRVYGSPCHSDLNALSTLLRKLATTSAGLEFLVGCREVGVLPSFVANCMVFTQKGPHLQRLAEKIRTRILKAAIRDSRQRMGRLQKDVDECWIRLFHLVTDPKLWSILVEQKDASFFRQFHRTAWRLRLKFVSLCAAGAEMTFSENYRHRSPVSANDSSAEPVASRSDVGCSDVGKELSQRERTLPHSTESDTSRAGEASELDCVNVTMDNLCAPVDLVPSQVHCLDPKNSDTSLPGLQPAVGCSAFSPNEVESVETANPRTIYKREGGTYHAETVQFRVQARQDIQAPFLPTLPQERNLIGSGHSGSAGHFQLPIIDLDRASQAAEPFQSLIPYLEENDPRLNMDVVNLSSVQLTNDQIQVLGLGLKFRRTTGKIPVLQLIAGAETTARDLERRNLTEANAFCIACSNAIQ